MTDFNVKYQEYVFEFESYLKTYTEKLKTNPDVLAESMKYSLLNGGKRVRPVLALASADVLGVDKTDILPFALAIEMIHCYSLIHDDLPAMDNDDFRRGKPSNHKVFGEANAILAGDALLNQAYFVCMQECMKGEKYVLASQFLNECAGIYGMLAGQSADLLFENTNQEVTERDLHYVDEQKTGKLLLAPIVIASILSGNKWYLALERFGKQLGKLFQMTDDILDVTGDFDKVGKSLGKDASVNKLTCVRLYGLDGAKLRADMCAADCHALLDGVDGNVEFLHALIDYVRVRCS